MVKKPKQSAAAESSAAQYLTFIASSGNDAQSVEMRYEDENIWLTQKMIAELYGVSKQAIDQHVDRLEADGEFDGSTVKQYLQFKQKARAKFRVKSITTTSKPSSPSASRSKTTAPCNFANGHAKSSKTTPFKAGQWT